jgi:hypothetical protein
MTLAVKGSDLLNAAKHIKLIKMPEILNKLDDHGFEIKGFVKNIKGDDEFIISYPDCPPLIAALKSMADAQKDIGKGDLRRSNAFFYMMMPDILQTDPVKEPKLNIDNMIWALNENNREIVSMFNGSVGDKTKSKVGTYDFMRNEWKCVYTGKKTKQVLLTLKAEQDNLNIKINLEHINDYVGAVKDLPDDLRMKIQNNAWGCNKETCNPRCVGGFSFEMDGVAYNKCRGGAFTFNDISMDDASHLKVLLDLELKRES